MPRRMLLLAGLAAGCGGARPADVPRPSPASADECVLSRGDSASGPVVAAALGRDTALVDPRRSGTPLGLSCTGAPLPRLASSWSADSSHRSWTLVVPSAGAVASYWRTDPHAAAALRLAGATSVVPLDDHRVVVSFEAPQVGVPGVLADPDLAPGPGDTAGLWRMRDVGPDLRDAVDGAADLVVTADPPVIEYATARGDRIVRPLPWNRSYVLLMSSPRAGPDLGVGDSAAFRASLAQDAVRVAARPASPPFWWAPRPVCPPSAGTRGTTSAGVAYPAGDPTARALAERVVAMASGAGLRVHPVADDALPATIGRGAWSAYVVPLPKVALVPCRWIATWPDSAVAYPLIETRSTAIVRVGAPPLLIDHDGGLVAGSRQ